MLLPRTREKLTLLPIEAILPNPDQPRRYFGSEELQALAESIAQNGLLQPISVRKSELGYMLIAGERRLRACKLAGLKEIPAIVNNFTQKESCILALTENIQRSDLQFFEEAMGIFRMMQRTGLTQEQAARKLGCSQSALANKLRLLKLGTAERQLIIKGGLTERHARAVLKIEKPEQRLKTLQTVLERGLNVRQTEELVEEVLHGKKERPKRKFYARDVRLFLNTIDHAVKSMTQAGIAAESERNETDDFIICTVKIKKH